MKHDDFVCKYFLVSVSISCNWCSEMPSGRSARFLQLADLLCVTVALLLVWLNQQEVLHFLPAAGALTVTLGLWTKQWPKFLGGSKDCMWI